MVDPSVHSAGQYAVLGLAPGADRMAVRAAYRRLAREFHPDVNRSSDAPERMRALNAAYAALTDDGPPPALTIPATPARSTGSVGGAAPRQQTPPRATVTGIPSWYRYVASAGSVGSAGAAGAVSPSAFFSLGQANAVTLGVVAGFFGLVALLGVWAFSVARPFAGATTSQTAQVRPAATRTIQSTTGTLAAQASANAAANAVAARSNLTAGTGVISGASGVAGAAASVSGAGSAAAPGAASTASTAAALTPDLPIAPAMPAAPVPDTSRAAQTLAAAPPAPAAAAPVDATAPTSAPATMSETRSAMPSIPAARAAQANLSQHIQAIQPTAAQSASDQATLTQTATRALSGYDKAWTAYAGALRAAAAGSLASAAASAGTLRTAGAPASAASFLSSDSQLTLARSLYLQQQSAWNAQAGAALTAAVSASPAASRPDAAKTVRAEQKLRQAADLLAQSQSSAAPLNVAQLKTLLDEAEQLHRESIAEWARLLGAFAS